MPVLPAETPLKEEAEGLAKSADALNKKSDVSKHIEVQVAQETRTVSIGKFLSELVKVAKNVFFAQLNTKSHNCNQEGT